MFLSYGNLVFDLLTELWPIEWVYRKKPKRKWPKTSKKREPKIRQLEPRLRGMFFP